MISSKDISSIVGRSHGNILRDIDQLLIRQPELNAEFLPADYIDQTHKQRRCYTITKDGALFLVATWNPRDRMRVIKKLGLEQTQPPSNVVSLAPPQSKLDVNQIGKMLRNEKAKFSLAASVYSLSRKFGYDNSRSRQVVDQYLFGLLGEHILDKMGLSNNAILSFEEVPPLCTNGVGKEFKTISELSNMVFLAPEKVLEKLKDMGFIGSDGEVSTNGVGSIIGSGPEALYHEDLKEIL